MRGAIFPAIMKPTRGQVLGYWALLSSALTLSVVFWFSSFANTMDNNAYDWMFRAWAPTPWEPRAMILAIDEPTLIQPGAGMGRVRTILADGLERLTPAKPKLVAIDLTLADEGMDAAVDQRLARVLSTVPNLILDCEMMPDGRSWEYPLPLFRQYAAAVGHAHAHPDRLDAVSREVPLELIAGRERRWSLSLEAFRVDAGAPIMESPGDLEIGKTVIPAARETGRSLKVRYLPPRDDGSPRIQRISFLELKQHPELAERFRDRAVFVGVTAQTLVRDRLFTPYSDRVPTPGVEIHATAYETMRSAAFLVDAPPSTVLAFCVFLMVAIGLTFSRLSGWASYTAGAILLALAHATPNLLFRAGIVFPVTAPLSTAWISTVAAAAWQHFVVRRQLHKSERDRQRYQQAIQFVTHEMRTPLTAIQGSSELMTRYALSDEKRKQMALTINSESKRLARMVQTFLDVERLTEGDMQLKREPFEAAAIVASCVERARPLAERKQMTVIVEPLAGRELTGDRELMEYAFYNLLTNAIKYSPAETRVTVRVTGNNGECRLAVADQGIGMDEKELRNIFTKFYRTKKAEASGEVGTGIGLSIVEQIVTSHGGRIEVESQPGRGSCFTIILPARALHYDGN
ncbi:MAG: CHASE2 domain-containing protein [Bryobacteraceae bacterium]